MNKGKYSLYKKEFYKQQSKPYKGRILMNNISNRILENTRMMYLIRELETVIQGWFDSASYIYKKINYRVEKDDYHTID